MTNTQELTKRRKAPLTAPSDIRLQAAHDITRLQPFQTGAARHRPAAAPFSTNEAIVATRQMKKYTFVLVHGAWFGAWVWRDVASGLREMGHVVTTPTLTGVGERRYLEMGQLIFRNMLKMWHFMLRWKTCGT